MPFGTYSLNLIREQAKCLLWNTLLITADTELLRQQQNVVFFPKFLTPVCLQVTFCNAGCYLSLLFF